jgi:hypothetical protein
VFLRSGISGKKSHAKTPRRKGKTGETDNSQRITKRGLGLSFVIFVLQREVFKHFDEDSRPREDKIIHNKVAKARRENISQEGHKGRKDRPFEFLKSVFVAFAILL